MRSTRLNNFTRRSISSCIMLSEICMSVSLKSLSMPILARQGKWWWSMPPSYSASSAETPTSRSTAQPQAASRRTSAVVIKRVWGSICMLYKERPKWYPHFHISISNSEDNQIVFQKNCWKIPIG